MSKFGFGHRDTRHIVIDHEGELWLAMAPQAIGGFLAMGMSGLPGTLRIEPLEGGAPVPFTYTATESILELTAKSGAVVRFAVDAPAQALRISGSGAFRLNGVSPAMRVSTLNTAEGVAINSGSNHYFFKILKGKVTFDDSWVLNEFRSATPVIDIEPEGGLFEILAYDLPEDAMPIAPTGTFDDCVAAVEADFEAFTGTLVDVPSEWDDVKRAIAYPLWLCHRFLDAKYEVVVENKYNSKNTDARLMAIAAMAFKDPRRAVEMITAYPPDMPPVAGVAAAALLDEELLNDSRGEIYKVYAALEAIASKCRNERATDKDGLSFYAYRFESGAGSSPEFFKAGEPVLAPDLNAYLAISCEVAGRLARMEYDDGAAQKWEAHASRLLRMLIADLWDGENFVGKNAYTGEASAPDEFLSLVPIILGNRLPQSIISKLAAKINAGNANSAVGFLLAGGLFDAGEKVAAASIALSALSTVRSGGVSCPFYGASLLALAHKVL